MCHASHIIVADDDESVRLLVSRILHRLMPRTRISMCDNGKSALESFEEQGADLLITDYMMPEMDGAELVEALRARDVTIPILLLSAVNRIPLTLRCDEQVRFLPKPFDIDQLEAAINTTFAPLLSVGK